MECNGNGIRLTVSPICSRDGETGLREALSQIRRNVDFDAHLLREARRLGIASGDQHAAIVEKLGSTASRQWLRSFRGLEATLTVASEW